MRFGGRDVVAFPQSAIRRAAALVPHTACFRPRHTPPDSRCAIRTAGARLASPASLERRECGRAGKRGVGMARRAAGWDAFDRHRQGGRKRARLGREAGRMEPKVLIAFQSFFGAREAQRHSPVALDAQGGGWEQRLAVPALAREQPAVGLAELGTQDLAHPLCHGAVAFTVPFSSGRPLLGATGRQLAAGEARGCSQRASRAAIGCFRSALGSGWSAGACGVFRRGCGPVLQRPRLGCWLARRECTR